MNEPVRFAIDLDFTFPHLPHAPIVEAVIHWQTIPANRMDQSSLERELREEFVDYSLRVQHGLETALAGSAEGVELRHRSMWDGFRLTSADEKQIGQFKPDAVVFSRLAPYEGWPPFVVEAFRFWRVHAELAQPTAIKRLGVRFISVIELEEGQSASEYVVQVLDPLAAIGLASESFFHKDTFLLGDDPYRIDLVRAIQGPSTPISTKRRLIVDIDVSTVRHVEVERAEIERHLSAMRFIKNKVFFSYLKDAESKFGGS